MLNKDFAGATARIAAANRPVFTPRQMPDFGADFAKAAQAYNDEQKKQALVSALQNGDEDAMTKAYADFNPEAAMHQRLDNMAYQRQLEKQKELAEYNHQNALELQKRKEAIALEMARIKAGEGYGTAAERNVEYLVRNGVPREQAQAMVFSGQNPSMGQIYPNLGIDGAKKTDQEQGKNYAADLDEYNNMVSKMPELQDTVKTLGNLAQDATYTWIGRAYDTANRELAGRSTKGGIARTEYEAVINNQILPLLRDTFGAAFTQKEGESLKATLGDINKTPEEKQAVLNSFINQKKASIESKYRKLQSYKQGAGASSYSAVPTDDDAWGGI